MNRIIRWLTLCIILSVALSACLNPAPTQPFANPTRPTSTIAPQSTNPPRPPGTTERAVTPNPSSSPIDTSGLIRDPVTDADRTDAQLVNSTDIPIGDLRELAIKFKGLPPDTPDKTCTSAPTYNVGDDLDFHVSNSDTFEQFTVTARLIAKTDHAYMWVDKQWLNLVNQNKLIEAAQTFSDKIYPRDRQLFGSEWSPGIDCDERLHILNTSNTGAGGYFSSVDEYPKAVRSESNEKEMFIIDIPGIGGPQRVGSDYYLGVLAHELQHMIHFHVDRNEEAWVNEGLSDLAMFLNGYSTGGAEYAFTSAPDTQLDFWPEGGGDIVNYGTAFMFWLYFYDKFGEQGITAIVANPLNGLDGVADALKQVGDQGSLDDFFANWVIANELDKPDLDRGEFGYARTDPPRVAIQPANRSYPLNRNDRVHQYAAKYYALRSNKDLTIDFAGSTKARLIDTAPHSGQYFMWSNRADSAAPTLTRAFDLSNVKSATLKYWTWYSIEKDWDYGYLIVSEDGGQSWKILKTPSGTDRNPNNSNFSWGYTGSSGGDPPQWIQETVDLSAYAGKKIILGFEVVNDLAANLPGLAVDDVEIPEINYQEDFEKGDGGWQSSGWIHTDNFVPQKYIAQLISFGQDGSINVSRLPIADDNTAQWDVPLSTLDQAIVVFSATAPKTSEVALFNWEAREK